MTTDGRVRRRTETPTNTGPADVRGRPRTQRVVFQDRRIRPLWSDGREVTPDRKDQKRPQAPARRYPAIIVRPMPNCATPRPPWSITYHDGASEGIVPASCRTDTGMRRMPERKATSTSQNVQRQRRSTPIPSRRRNAVRAIRNTTGLSPMSPSGRRSTLSYTAGASLRIRRSANQANYQRLRPVHAQTVAASYGARESPGPDGGDRRLARFRRER